jgi:hypothetical protein
MTDPAAIRLGKHLGVVHDPRTLQLARYTAAVPKPPSSGATPMARLGTPQMFANDTYGDCTCAAAGHLEVAWLNHMLALTDQDILDLYWRTGTQDTGRYPLDVLNEWRKNGLAGHKIGAFAKVDPTNRTHVAQAIWLFGGIYLGFALPKTAQHQKVWDVVNNGGPDAKPGSWGGHMVDGVAWGSKSGIQIATWNEIVRVTWDFLATYCDEAYAVLSPDWLTAGKSPQGFDIKTLAKDLGAI